MNYGTQHLPQEDLNSESCISVKRQTKRVSASDAPWAKLRSGLRSAFLRISSRN